MADGIRIVNDHGTVLIDENYRNLAVRQQGVVNTSTTSSTTAVAITSGIDAPMIAIAPSNRPAYVASISPTAMQFRIGSSVKGSSTMDYYLFDVPLPSGGTTGLKIYAANGLLCFDSNLKYARVVEIFGGAAVVDWAGTRTFTAGRKYAVVQLKSALIRSSEKEDRGIYTNTWQQSMVQVVGNVVTTSMRVSGERTGDRTPVSPVNNTAASFAVIDVTGY